MIPPILNQASRVKPLFNYLKKQQENRKFIKSVEISATFTLITFFMIFAIRPTFLTIAKLNGDIESKKILKTELKNKINQVIQAQDLYSQVQERYLVVNSSLPDRPNYYLSAAQIQKTGEFASIPVSNLTFDLNPAGVGKTDLDLSSYSVSLKVGGQFKNAVSLISKLLNNRRVIDISSINFETTAENISASPSANGQINTNFSSIFYYWPPINEKK